MSAATITLPPSALAVRPSDKMSERYAFVDTRLVVQELAGHGFQVDSARAVQTRKKDPLFAKHQIVFSPTGTDKVIGGEGRVRAIFTNSHDGSSGVGLRQGFYRFICSNGMVIGSEVASFTARHAGDAAREAIERIRAMSADTLRLSRTITEWGAIQLTRAQQEEFAALAGQLRYGDAQTFDPKTLLAPKRPDDVGTDLWRTLNVLQENTVRGGISGFSAAGRRVRAVPITGFDRDTQYNADLWKLAEEVAEAVA